MIDDVTLKWQIDPPEQEWERTREPFYYLGFLFDPSYRDGFIIKYVSKFRNLRLVIKDDIFLISGSWHKFHHRGNYGDYTLKEIIETIEELKERFGEKFLNAEITKLTIGCNVSLEANKILPKIIGINGKKPSDMLGGTNHQPYGKYFKMTFYRFKVYDKQFEVKNHDGIKIPHVLRLEKEIKMKGARKRANNPITIISALDLLKPEFSFFCQTEMKEFTQKLEFSKVLIVSDLDKAADIEIYKLMGDMDSRLAYKKLANPKTYRSKLKRFQELKQNFSHSDPDLSDLVSKKVEEKISELVARSPLLKTG
ncbi:hypothetical protein Q4534_02650 [Cyclobacterium sp. 1_MG-2023]|uniref:hypothetical protein n=1 Tax=Cyclobacterium sp. 1_MG-2023 TaxID=3062681 RepID=UPI0026E209F2|nr:hypothetical protein [Cyclobacterium sp. 1_MG-2023]MDO6436286.1 hypothetical protein [Cyclobacterium sp. 1_MG-2023]